MGEVVDINIKAKKQIDEAYENTQTQIQELESTIYMLEYEIYKLSQKLYDNKEALKILDQQRRLL